MNQHEWRFNLIEKPKGIWNFRNKAVKYFNCKKGEVIHHLRETEEQRQFNDQYYERWGFDFDGEMKYAIKMTKEEHSNYHKCSEETKQKMHNSQLGNKNRLGISHSLETKEKLRQANLGKKQSQETKDKQSKIRKGIPQPKLLGNKNASGKRTLEQKKKISETTQIAMQNLSIESKQKMIENGKKAGLNSRGKNLGNKNASGKRTPEQIERIRLGTINSYERRKNL